MTTPRCPVCGSNRVTPPTPLSGGRLELTYVTNPQGGFMSKGLIVAHAGVGCACLDCGYVMCFVGPTDLQRLRESAQTLHPNAP